jgi:UDP:flavonoid glycosyltransferase YjiC (YdhE family)
MLVVPYGGDQFDNGARIERLGVGTAIRREHYRAGYVAEAMQRLLSNTITQQTALQIGQQIQHEQGVQTACEAIKQLLMNFDDQNR